MGERAGSRRHPVHEVVLLATASALSACSPVVDTPGDGASVDGAPAAPPDARDTPDAAVDCDDSIGLPFRPSNIDPCGLTVNGSVSLTEPAGEGANYYYRFDTDDGTITGPGISVALATVVLEQTDGPDVRVFAASSFSIGPEVHVEVHGSLPLVILTVGELSIGGTLEAAASATASGPGGDDERVCAIGRGHDADRERSGGGGGAFADRGGTGATVNDSGSEPTEAGSANGSDDLVPLRGGCGGGRGGAWVPGNGDAGAGGGAVQLIAGGALVVEAGAILTARGGAGSGIDTPSKNGGGGGGGGSGGGFLLEATSIEVHGAITANGGGGGEGSFALELTNDGSDGSDTASDRAIGGGNGGNGGDGGAGGSGLGLNGQDGLRGVTDGKGRPAGGGGGGGSAGRIHLRAGSEPVIDGALFSPQTTIEVGLATSR